MSNKKAETGHEAEHETEVKSISERALATIAPSGGALITSPSGKQFKVKAQVTRPVLKQEDKVAIFVLFTGPIHRAEERRGEAKEGQEKDRPPMIADITNLETGQLQTLVCGAVLQGELEEKYKDDGYIGRAFRLESLLIPMQGKSGQRMRIYDIQELEAA